MSFAGWYNDRSVLVTGDTGFKGAWLTRWLTRLGARVHGFALPPERPEDLFACACLNGDISHVDGDIRSLEALSAAVGAAKPDIVFHLAAQALVGRSYSDPVETIATNVMGTAHILECVRRVARPVSVVIVTSDKCYANQHSDEGYVETDPLGGDDIYSASKGAAEVITGAYRRSFFDDDANIRVATVRAGNVIGPGDWSEGRLIPDAVRALSRNEPLKVRNPHHVRPWQYVLEPLSGYLWLGAMLQAPNGASYASAFNFGPEAESCISVAKAADRFVASFEGPGWEHAPDPGAFRETKLLRLQIGKAAAVLRWRPVWNVDEAIDHTAKGYRSLAKARDADAARAFMDREIDAYRSAAVEAHHEWALDGHP